MTMKYGDLPAAPVDMTNSKLVAMMQLANGDKEAMCAVKAMLGLTKREQFAMAAMHGLCSATNVDGTWQHDAETIATTATQYADALLAELERAK